MPLQKQLVTLPFAFGLESKSDEKQVALGRLTRLENGIFTTLKQIRKRNGYEALPRLVFSETGLDELSSASALTSFRDELLAVGRSSGVSDSSRLFSYAEGANAWTSRGDFTPCAASSFSIMRATEAVACVDGVATDSGELQVYVWERGTSVYYSAVDTASGQVIVSSALVSANAARPRVVPFAGGVSIYYVDIAVGAVFFRRLIPSTNASLQPAVQVTAVVPGSVDSISTTATLQVFDVIRAENLLVFAFSNDAGTLTARRYNPSNQSTPVAQLVASTVAPPAALSIAYNVEAESILVASAGNNSASSIRVSFLGTDRLLATAFVERQLFLSGTAQTPLQVGAASVPGAPAASRFRVWVSVRYGPASSFPDRLSTFVYSASGTTTPAAPGVLLSLAIVSRPWAFGGRSFAAVAFESRTTGSPSGLQNQVLVVSDRTTSDTFSIEPVARVLYGTSSGVLTSRLGGGGTLPAISETVAGAFRLATLEAATLTTAVGDVQTIAGVTSLVFDFRGAPLSDNRSEIGGSLVFGGGCLSTYDGIGVVEQGFFAWPDECTVTLSGGGALSAGVYQWVAVYEWTDNNGFVHRSAASLPATATATSGQSAAVTISCLHMTRKQARTPVSIVVYRTLANGTTFYRASSLTTPTANSNAYRETFSDTVSDATLQTRPLLYTTGGVVENIPPGAVNSLVTHRGRLWAIDALNPLRLWFSRQITTGAPVEFSDVLSLDVDSRGGGVVALGSLDDKLVVFKRTQIFVVSGQGPDATGSQNDFSDSVLVTSDVGCIDARSLVVTPAGLVFQSTKGIFLLDRSLAVSYIGADVEAYNSETVESGQLIPTANQVRFILGSGVALVFDFFVNQWSVFTNHVAVDSVLWLDRFCYARADGTVLREDPSRHDDAGSFVGLRLATGWIVFDGGPGSFPVAAGGRQAAPLQLYQRARRLLVLGDYCSPHRLRVRVSFDYSPAVDQDVTVEAPTTPTFGGTSPYGIETPYGGTWLPYQWRIDLERQKCQAVKVELIEQRVGTELGEGVRLSALSVELGIKPTSARVPMNRVAG